MCESAESRPCVAKSGFSDCGGRLGDPRAGDELPEPCVVKGSCEDDALGDPKMPSEP
jgi:hypothetical protein